MQGWHAKKVHQQGRDDWGEREFHTRELNCDISYIIIYIHIYLAYVVPYVLNAVIERDRK